MTCLPSLLHSWDTVQTYIHFANQSGSYGQDAMDAFAKQAFVVFEKDQGRWPQAPQPDDYPTMEFETAQELKVQHACAQVKQANPSTQCYIYTGSECVEDGGRCATSTQVVTFCPPLSTYM